MIHQAAKIIKNSTAILIGAGAGIGVDSGLPDFRGPKGFWREYPYYEKLGLRFVDLANPSLFINDPKLAWGFYYHRKVIYNRTQPHLGFDILKKWSSKINNNLFIYTSNVDQQFQKAGFSDDQIIEIHGNINRLQCSKNCGHEKFYIPNYFRLDEQTMRIEGDLPFCLKCGTIARPNILMFYDYSFYRNYLISQYTRYFKWLKSLHEHRLSILEIGAGLTIPSVRNECENIAKIYEIPIIRINLDECINNCVCLKMKSIEALSKLNKLLEN